MIAWASLLGVLAAAGGLQIDTSTPDALCPDLGQVRQAAQSRLGDIEAEGAWRASYALIHRPDGQQAGDVVRLDLRDPTGRLRLRRDLPRAGESCAALARALVVVLDGYFRHPTDARAPAPADHVLATMRGRRAPPASRLAFDLAGGWAGGWSGADRSSPLISLGVRLSLLSPAWWVGVEGSWLLARHAQTLDDATASERSFALRSFLVRDLLGGGGRAALLVGPELVLALDRADGAMLRDGAARMRASFGGGLRAHLQIALAPQLLFGLLAALDYLPSAWGGSFWVERSPMATEIFPASQVRLMMGMGLSWAVY
jgi:hypothetical protein